MPGALASAAIVLLSSHAFDNAKFGPVETEAKPRSYLSVDLEYPPFEETRVKLEKRIGHTLSNRGEAHITVVTPPEFKKLAAKLLPSEIEKLIHSELDLKPSGMKPICIGQGQVKTDQTWFVVIEMKSATEARKSLAAAFVKAGGVVEDFNADEFHPHVTLGFDKRDLHLQDGVVKDSSSCRFRLRR